MPPCRSHPDQPWALIADAGRSARDLAPTLTPTQRTTFWCETLAAYAELQRSVGRGLTDLGLPDFTPDQLLARFDEAVADSRWWRPTTAPELTPQDWDRVRGCRPRLERAARRLAGGLPASVQHDDLHDGNVFVDEGTTRIIDWGDAVRAHPFGTLLVTLRSLAAQWRCRPIDPALRRVQAAYLEPWRAGGGSAADLADQVDLAVRTGPLTRACGWIRALGEPEAGVGPGRGRRSGVLDGPAGR